MGIATSIGAQTAAGEILAFVKQKIAENQDKPEVVKVLTEVQDLAVGIVKTAEAGYY